MIFRTQTQNKTAARGATILRMRNFETVMVAWGDSVTPFRRNECLIRRKGKQDKNDNAHSKGRVRQEDTERMVHYR